MLCPRLAIKNAQRQQENKIGYRTMQCFLCAETARGICRFCGRALCEDHMQDRKPYVLTIYVGKDHTPKVVVVEDALYCGECKPRAQPVDMPEIY